jgi:hypothetical protein
MESGFGTSSSSLLALPSPEEAHANQARPIWLFAAGRPDEQQFVPVDMSSP